ncbi:MAG TPA: glycoside hydrolase family 3 C-terminal domain-containing protein, partial [Pyrinomonadaceae bacterium]|nr:glycoside hydrolase family 3 C-terminal domain-containing protein [Pyrinomonadaceae bacterium]
GPTADSLISLNNGWTYVWQGSEPSLYPKDKPTIQAAIAAKLGSNVTYVPGTRIVRKAGTPSNNNPTNIDEEVDIAAAVVAAKSADTIVLCLGEGSYTESPGSIEDLTLPELQLKLAEALIATGKPVVLVMSEGRPRVISRIADKVGGIVLALDPGNEGGRAVADVLFGDYNPDGKLPITYPRAPGYFPTYDAQDFGVKPGEQFSPQFAFGTGLSFTTFTYSDLKLSSKTIGMGDKLNVSVKITNTGKLAGKETAIMFLRDEVASITPPAKRVKRFAKIWLASGESKTLTFTLGVEDLQFINLDNKPIAEAGDFTVMVGGLSQSFTLK